MPFCAVFISISPLGNSVSVGPLTTNSVSPGPAPLSSVTSPESRRVSTLGSTFTCPLRTSYLSSLACGGRSSSTMVTTAVLALGLSIALTGSLSTMLNVSLGSTRWSGTMLTGTMNWV